MHGILIAVGLTTFLPGTTAGPGTTGVMAPVYQFVDAFNDAAAKQEGITDGVVSCKRARPVGALLGGFGPRLSRGARRI